MSETRQAGQVTLNVDAFAEYHPQGHSIDRTSTQTTCLAWVREIGATHQSEERALATKTEKNTFEQTTRNFQRNTCTRTRYNTKPITV